MTEKSLKWLQAQTLELFARLPPEVQASSVQIARRASVNRSQGEIHQIADILGIPGNQRLAIIKATRYLAIIRRDFDNTAFDQTVQLLVGTVTEWRLASGEVVVDREQSHVHGSETRLLLSTVFAQVQSGRDFIIYSHDFKVVVGETICVRTGPRDRIVYAQRQGRLGLTRFVKNRLPKVCSVVTVMLKLFDERRYEIVTAYIGNLGEPEPWDRRARSRVAESLKFWTDHAIVWGTEEVVPGTETTRCPW